MGDHIMKLITPLLFAFISSTQASAACLFIRIDVSDSTPIIESQSYRNKVANDTGQRIEALNVGDLLNIQTFGEYSPAEQKSIRVKFDRSTRPYKVIPAVKKAINSLGGASTIAQGQTNIIGTMETAVNTMGFEECKSSNTTLVLYTDGIEASEYMRNGQAFVDGEALLPVPKTAFLQDMRVDFVGVGVLSSGGSSSYTNNILAAWRTYMTAAGAQFTARTAL